MPLVSLLVLLPAGRATWLQPLQHLHQEAIGLGSGAEQVQWHHHCGKQSQATANDLKRGLAVCATDGLASVVHKSTTVHHFEFAWSLKHGMAAFLMGLL
jgi:hypothetical protein